MARNYVKNNPYLGKSWDGRQWLYSDGTPLVHRSWALRKGISLVLIVVLASIGLFLAVLAGMSG